MDLKYQVVKVAYENPGKVRDVILAAISDSDVDVEMEKLYNKLSRTQRYLFVYAYKELRKSRKNEIEVHGADEDFQATICYADICAVVPDKVKLTRRTLFKVADYGLLDMKVHSHTRESLRRGPYGKWIGGTNIRYYASYTLKLTPLGERMAEYIKAETRRRKARR